MASLRRGKIVFIVLISITIIIISTAASGESYSFLKKGSYPKAVVIDNPEISLLAEEFIRNGITVYDKPHIQTLSFKPVNEEHKIIVNIYYTSEMMRETTYVGKFVYFKNKTPDELTHFVKSFVAWTFTNAWGRP